MKSIQFLFVIFAALLLLAFVSSCEDKEVKFSEDETIAYSTDGSSEAAFASVEGVLNEGMNYVEENGMARTAATQSVLDCATLTLGGTKSSGVLDIDFGDGCTAIDGRVWQGKISLKYTGRRFVEGSYVTATFTNFYIDGYKIEGDVKSTTVSVNLQQAQATFNVLVTNGKLTWPDESFATWNAERTHTWTISDNGLSLSVEGTAYGVNVFGTEYSTEINQPLIFKSECVPSSAYIAIQGIKTITVGEDLSILVDYGAGACDRSVKISIGRQSKDVNF